jgi:hypothetical protein
MKTLLKTATPAAKVGVGTIFWKYSEWLPFPVRSTRPSCPFHAEYDFSPNPAGCSVILLVAADAGAPDKASSETARGSQTAVCRRNLLIPFSFHAVVRGPGTTAGKRHEFKCRYAPVASDKGKSSLFAGNGGVFSV